MEDLQRSESRRRYSWWWASHISPRNSKWLQETLADMDNKIKEMIKLINEDGDTFAKRAEMFYKKRPEFMKLLEEFYRAYRALAERCDHATGALRQTHQAMTKAFPNQIPLMPTDGSPSGSSAPEEDPDYFEMPPTIHDLLDALQQDALSVSSHLNETFAVGEETTYPNTTEERVRQGIEEEEKFSEYKLLEKEISRLLMEEQALKSQIMSESVRAGRAETEIQSLKHTFSEVKSEKRAALLRCQQSEERIAYLEMEISHTEEEIGKLNDQMLMGAKHLSVALEKCLMLEKVNESLQLELEALRQREKEQQEQLNAKQKELEELQISLEDEKLKSFQAEMAFLTLEKFHVESQNEMRLLILLIQSGVKKLKDMSQNLSEDSIVKLEDEVALHVKGNKVLQEKLSCLEEDTNDLEQTHHVPTEKIPVVNINVDSLRPLVEELKHEDEQDTPFQNLKQMKEMPEKNAFMENSVSNADAQLERLREKIKKTLEGSCEYFCAKISIHQSEEAVPVSQVDSNAQKMERHLEKSTFLENSLLVANIELQDLREKLEELGKYCQRLHDQNSDLLAQKITLVSQVESSSKSLENMESKYAELESKYLNLEKERDLALHQVRELQELLKNEKEEHQTLIPSNKCQLSILENKIFSLQEEIQYREEELEVEQHKVLNAQIEIFILHRCLCDMEEKNMVHLAVRQKNEEALGHAENLISQLEQDHLIREENIRSLSAKYEKLREGVHLILKILVAEEYGSLDDIKDELLLQIIVHEVRCLMESISEAKDEKQHLVSEKSVIVGLLEQFGQHGADLRSEKMVLDQESETRTEELLLLHSKRLELFEMNEKLRQEIQASNQRQEPLKAEMDILYGQSSDLLEFRSLQKEISRLQEENCSLSKRLDSMMVKQSIREEENSIIHEETMALEYLSLIFRSFVAEKALDIHLLKNDVDHLSGARDELSQENRLTVAKLGVLELEDKHIKDTVANLEECRRRLVMIENDFGVFKRVSEQLHQQMGIGSNLLIQKDMELLQANQKIQEAQDMITELHRNMEGLKLGMDEVEVAREKREKKISTLPEDNAKKTIETACLDQENEILKGKLNMLRKEVGGIRRREEHLTSKLQRGRDEDKYCEEKIASLIADIQSTTINAAIYEERALELTATSDNLETSAMVQRKVLNEETTLENVHVGELRQKLEAQERENRELKTHLTAYVPLVVSLGGAVALLEEHILRLANHSSVAKQEKQGVPLVPLQIKKSSQEPIKDHSAKDLTGVLRLQQLHAKVEALQRAIMDIRSLLGQQRFDSDANLEAARKEIEALKSKGILDDEITKARHEQKMKDVQLDYFSSSSQYENSFGSNEQRKMGNAETNDQELELWGIITEGGHKNEIEVTPAGTTEYYLESHQIKTVEEGKGKHPVCDLGFNKLELPKGVMMESHQEWNRRIIERLSSDAQRLLVLQTSVQELEANMKTYEEVNELRRFEFNTVKGQLKEAEAIILQLIATNSKLTKKAKEFVASPDHNLLEENVDTVTMRQKIISERAQRLSERIGKLELKLHKIQYISLKLEEEHVNMRTKARGGRSKIILWDYIHGRINSSRKKAPRCGCFRIQLKND